MNKICSCYVTYEECSHFPNTKLIRRCMGTKERDECTCGGDETECDFYPEKRERARAEREVYSEPKFSLEDVKEAIDKRIAKKPITKKIDVDGRPYLWLCCPSCEEQLISHESYCRHCGQRLLWALFE